MADDAEMTLIPSNTEPPTGVTVCFPTSVPHRPLAVTVLPIPFARRAAATACASVQSGAPLFRRW
jgi:hypothetical protein